MSDVSAFGVINKFFGSDRRKYGKSNNGKPIFTKDPKTGQVMFQHVKNPRHFANRKFEAQRLQAEQQRSMRDF